ncbi:hypothetical protein CRM22_007782 [Opisthorchis felineus]|uniref:Mediator of RNA polymerase II transcription subunit 18 n=1 Tax=Opisthorchis felineus TaxID=147828 RepID=A0A4S2LER3_OPIFE|nr:hypothetical protein CRM22_007782 [Opisthorchis felineus]TGZ61820.1 hypothetical protein CRM22_007782 [Opisthorchis felineus]
MSSSLNETLLPGESGSVAEVLGSSGGIGHSSSTEPTDAATATALTAAFHFTGTSASANGATMQEYFIQSVVSSSQQHELLVTRLRGLSREWSEFCDQEISFQLGSEDRGDSASVPRSISGSTTSAGVLSTVAPAATSSVVNVRLRRSLLPAMQFPDRRLSALRYLGAVETDRTVSRRSCLEVPVTGPLVCFLQELGFEPEFTYVAEGLIFIRGRVKVCVYTVNEVVQFESPAPSMPGVDGISGQDSYPKEWRRVCPNSWLVEISAVGSPADESLQDEVAEFADLLFPVIVPGKLDNSLFMRK